jgi:hypothetical protein
MKGITTGRQAYGVVVLSILTKWLLRSRVRSSGMVHGLDVAREAGRRPRQA